jgi:hypothetical protein
MKKFIFGSAVFLVIFSVTSTLFLSKVPVLQYILPTIILLTVAFRIFIVSTDTILFDGIVEKYKENISQFPPIMYRLFNHGVIAAYTTVLFFGEYYTLACLNVLTYAVLTYKLESHPRMAK